MSDADTTIWDVAVVGLGAMGAAVALQAMRAGASVIGIDRFDPPHDLGSTKAETRITRLAVGEGPQYLPFVRRSHEIWRELSEESGRQLLHECGGFIITEQEPVPGQRWEDFVLETARIAELGGIDYEVMEPADARARQPWINVPNDRRVGFEPSAGLVMAEEAVRVQLSLAAEAGAVLRRNETVLEVTPRAQGVEIRTDSGRYRCRSAVLAAGPWMSELVTAETSSQLTVTRQVVYWFEADDLDAFGTGRIPFVMWIADRDEDYIGLFPRPPGGTPGVKILGEQFLETTTADDVDRTVSQQEIDEFYERHVAPKFAGITRSCVRAEVCLYTNTPDDHFLIDTDPRSDRILVMSPCSGHGFKHSAALGEAVAQRLVTGLASSGAYDDGTSDLDLDPFRPSSG